MLKLARSCCSRLETFEYFQDRMTESKTLTTSDLIKIISKVHTGRHASTPTLTTADSSARTAPKKAQTPATAERKRKAQAANASKKQRRGSTSSPSDDSEDRPAVVVAGRKDNSSSPHPTQKICMMSPTELDANDGYVAADIFSQIVETKIIRAAHRTKFYSARVVDARRAPIEVILRVLTKLEPVVGTSNDYKFQNRLHRDALIELGRLTAAFVHYCGWNNRFDEWVTIDRIKVSPETKRLSMLTLIRTYNFSPNLLDAVHNFFKRRRITREKYRARRRALNLDDVKDNVEVIKKSTAGGGKKKEFSQLDGPPAPIILQPELQAFLYEDEGFKIPVPLPEKIEKDEYDEMPNDELAASNAMMSDHEINNGDEDSDVNVFDTPTTSKRPLKRKKAELVKEVLKTVTSPKEKSKTETKALQEGQVVKKKKKMDEEKSTPVKKSAETQKSIQQKQKEESKQTQRQTLKETKEAVTGKQSAVHAKQEKKEEKLKEKPLTRSATPVKRQQLKSDSSVGRLSDFTVTISSDEIQSNKSTPKSADSKLQKSNEMLLSVDAPIAVTVSPHPETPKIRDIQTPTDGIQSEIVQQLVTTDFLSSTSQRQTPIERHSTKIVDFQANMVETVPGLSSVIKEDHVQAGTTQQELAKEDSMAGLEFKPFSPISPPQLSDDSTVEVIKATESVAVTKKDRISPRSRFLQTLAEQPKPVWNVPNTYQSDAELAAEFEVQEDRGLITFNNLSHIPPALLDLHLNVPFTSTTKPTSENYLNSATGKASPQQSSLIPNTSQQRFASSLIDNQGRPLQHLLTPAMASAFQTFNSMTSMSSGDAKFVQQLMQQQPTSSFDPVHQQQIKDQTPINSQLLVLLQQTLQQQQALQQRQSQITQQNSSQNFAQSAAHLPKQQLSLAQIGTSITQQSAAKPSTSTSTEHKFARQNQASFLQQSVVSQQANSSKPVKQTSIINANKPTSNTELNQTPALQCLTEYVLLLLYLSVDSATQEVLETLRRNLSMTRYDALRTVRPQFTNIVARIAQLDVEANQYVDPVMRPLIEAFVLSKVSSAIRMSEDLMPMLQQYVHPVVYNEILQLPSPSQVASISLAQLQLLMNQQQNKQLNQLNHDLTVVNNLSDQLIAQQQAQMTQQNTADQMYARLQAMMMLMHNRSMPRTAESAYVSPPNDSQPSALTASGRQTSQNKTSAGTEAYEQCATNSTKQKCSEFPLVFAPGIYTVSKSSAAPRWKTSVNQQESNIQMKVESVEPLARFDCVSATLNVKSEKQSQQAECDAVWPVSRNLKFVAALNQKSCEDCGANPSVVEMSVLNKMPFCVRAKILDSYAKEHRMSKERRNRPQCKVKNLSKQAQKQKIERRRNEDMLEELRSSNGKDFLLLDERFCDSHVPMEPPLLCDIFSSIGYDIFVTDRVSESEEIKKQTEASIKEMSQEEVRENVLKLMKEHNVDQTDFDFENLEDLNKYIYTLSNIAEQHQVRLGLANYNLEMTEEITNTVIGMQKTIAEEQQRCEKADEAMLASAAVINKNRPKYLMHRGRKGYY